MAEALRYTPEHTWVKQEGKQVKVGITDYAQNELGDIVFVDLPDVWEEFIHYLLQGLAIVQRICYYYLL